MLTIEVAGHTVTVGEQGPIINRSAGGVVVSVDGNVVAAVQVKELSALIIGPGDREILRVYFSGLS